MNNPSILLLFILLVTFSCISYAQNDITPCHNDTSLLSAYKNQLESAAVSDRKFILEIIRTLEEFQCRQLDTTIMTICKIDDNFEPDTVLTHIFDSNDTIIVNYSWTKEGELQWNEAIINPYLWINEDALFQFDTRNKWVTFTIGIYYAIPEIFDIQDYQHLFKLAAQQGSMELKNIGFEIEPVSIVHYLENFKGNIITFGDPENSAGMLVWYYPMNRFILFYHH